MAKMGRPRKNPLLCTLPGCHRVFYGQGYCRSHFLRWKKHGDPGAEKIGAPRGRNAPEYPDTCLVEGCGGESHTRGYCNGHYLRLRLFGDAGPPNILPKRGRNKGGRWTDHGYVIVSEGGVRVREHRQVMEQHLGRPLLKNETVHHKNGVRHDNRLSNLEVWVSSQPIGQRPCDLVEWAREILRIYG